MGEAKANVCRREEEWSGDRKKRTEKGRINKRKYQQNGKERTGTYGLQSSRGSITIAMI